jgi:hypothetical protein
MDGLDVVNSNIGAAAHRLTQVKENDAGVTLV